MLHIHINIQHTYNPAVGKQGGSVLVPIQHHTDSLPSLWLFHMDSTGWERLVTEKNTTTNSGLFLWASYVCYVIIQPPLSPL